MAYHVTLDVFEGPMDLLLHLIAQARLEIKDIFVSPIIQQYLEYVERMPAAQMERTSEFIAMATRLLEIKSRWLLPKTKSRDDEDSLETDLIRQLELYRQYKLASLHLGECQEQAAGVFYHLPQEMYQQERVELGDMTLALLVQAFERMKDRLTRDALDRLSQEEHIPRDQFSISERVLHIRKQLMRYGKLPFFALFSGAVSREEVVVTFLALLEMVKNALVDVAQPLLDGPIDIVWKNGEGEHGDKP